MIRPVRASVASALVLAIAPVFCAPAFALDFEKDAAALRRIHRQLAPSIVTVDTIVRERTPQGIVVDTPQRATGLVHDDRGGIVAPSSLVNGAIGGRPTIVSVEVHDADGEAYEARFVGRAPEAGFAFFRVAAEKFAGTPITFAEDDTLDIGDFFASVRLAGPNFGHAPYLDAFMVSARIDAPKRCYVTSFAVSDYLGGPVVALDGRVVGLVGSLELREAAAAPKGLFASPFGFADDGHEVVIIPAEHFRDVLASPPELETADAPDDTPVPRPPWLGVETQALLPELADGLGFEGGTTGVIVTRVFPDSPALRAGLRLSDAVLRVDGAPLDAAPKQQNRDFRERIADKRAGDRVRMQVVRAGTALELDVELGEEPLRANEVDTHENETFGVAARDLVYADRADLRLTSGSGGARLVSVRATGLAGLGGLAAGDIVERVGDVDVGDVARFMSLLERAEAERAAELVLFVRRGRGTQFVHIIPDW